MKILVTGASGQLGTDLTEELRRRGHTVLGTDADTLDVTDEKSVNEYFENQKPQCVIHCAAYTNVDLAEEQEDICRKINSAGTRNIAEACKKIGAKIIYPSTDYVFCGEGETPFKPDDTQAPINVYGQTKHEGEPAALGMTKHFCVRISWVFGRGGKNFVKTMLRLSETHSKLTVVDDQIGAPTYTRDLSRLLADMAESEKYGIYHASNSGEYISWYQFAKAIFGEGVNNV